jgi:TrmH family RNA methyltransferase
VQKALEYIGASDSEGGDGNDIAIAIVFGRENSGLTNEELEKCNVLLHIPTNPDFSSLNIAAAVQVVCYEFRMALNSEKVKASKGNKHRFDVLADAEKMEGMYNHLFESLDHLEFFGDHNPDVVMRRLKGLFNRASTTRREVSIIRGICTPMQRKKLPPQ